MRRIGGLFFVAIFIVILFFRQGINLYIDWLWFQEVGFSQVLTTVLTYKTLVGVIAGLLFAALVYLNLRIAVATPSSMRLTRTDDIIELPPVELIDPLVRRMLLPGALLLAFMAVPQGAASWDDFALFLNPVSFNLADPEFGLDLSFFIFRLPALKTVYNWLIFALGLSLVATAVAYLLYRGLAYTPRGVFFTDRARSHLFVLLAAVLIVKAAGYYIDGYDLLYSPRGAAFGASYADVYGNLPALRLLAVVCLLASALCVIQLFRPGYTMIILGVGAVFLIHIVGLNVYPSLLQRFRVVPNEIEAERPFIERNIKFTRLAYGLDRIESKEFPAEEQLSARDIARNQSTIKNIRLWDHRPLLATYAQLQEIRTYYKFVDVDNDRYIIDGNYRQMMLSARELSHQHLQSRNWINEHLTFTHGHGVVFGPVNQVTESGQPEFFIKDIPPVSNTALEVTRPEIYFGELANEYVIVKTNSRELDYPSGDQNIYTDYDGRGGINIGSLWRKLIFSAHSATLRLLLSQDMTSASRILLHRQIRERVAKIAPFLTFDRDPYLVIAEEGRLFWIVDAYTMSNAFPYSEPMQRQGQNYVRNSVKAVIDAYHGTVEFYLADEKDPVIQAYSKIFPGMFKALSAMPDSLRSHVRYPQDLFRIQARMYSTYHMQDPQVFYNKEDLLSIPRQNTEGSDREMEPYYTIMRLPGEAKEEFVLLLPFTPNKRDNMRAWLAARSDDPHYGKLIALDFPKAKLIYGPKQIDARIDQDTVISQQLSLWNQRGSQVIRGSLLAIPIEKSLLYVQPLYLAAEKGSLPELKRVIVAMGNQIVMDEDLDKSLQQIFGSKPAIQPQPVTTPTVARGDASKESVGRDALAIYLRGQEYLRQGNWSAYGEEQRKLEAALRQLQELQKAN